MNSKLPGSTKSSPNESSSVVSLIINNFNRVCLRCKVDQLVDPVNCHAVTVDVVDDYFGVPQAL